MDTRKKIIEAPWPEFVRPLAVVTGSFDVLRVEHARDLEHARDDARAATLLAIVLPDPAALLPQRARAELVAALRAVDYVVVADAEDVEGIVRSLQPAELFRLEGADEGRAHQLRELVRSRTRNA